MAENIEIARLTLDDEGVGVDMGHASSAAGVSMVCRARQASKDDGRATMPAPRDLTVRSVLRASTTNRPPAWSKGVGQGPSASAMTAPGTTWRVSEHGAAPPPRLCRSHRCAGSSPGLEIIRREPDGHRWTCRPRCLRRDSWYLRCPSSPRTICIVGGRANRAACAENRRSRRPLTDWIDREARQRRPVAHRRSCVPRPTGTS